MSTEQRVYELHVKPTYSVVVPQRSPGPRLKTEKQLENEVNLKDNNQKGRVSKKSAQRLNNAVNWLVASAKDKTIYDKKTKKRFNFKINFVTLTLPTLDHQISDHKFKTVLLHAFINTCRYKYDLKNFVWKVETQANGNIHAHFTTDCFIHWADLRRTWNKILSKNGAIGHYQAKHEKMSFEDYCTAYNLDGKKSEIQLKKSYDFGVSNNWTQPNSTDVHAVHKVKDIGAYLAKYLGKNDDERRVISGRLWSCSYNLSESNKLVIEMSHPDDFKYLECLHHEHVRYTTITHVNQLTKQVFTVGEVFFYNMKYWGSIIKGRLLDAFNNHRWKIRTGVDIQALKASQQAIITEPIKIVFDTFSSTTDDDFTQFECPF